MAGSGGGFKAESWETAMTIDAFAYAASANLASHG